MGRVEHFERHSFFGLLTLEARWLEMDTITLRVQVPSNHILF